jgi:aldehyde dehydrogenase (NAD+)
MVTANQRDRVTSYIEIGKAEGAVVAAGGKDPAVTQGWFVDATIFTHATPDMGIAREEIFGPVLPVLPYDDEDEAVTFANDSDYGLNGAVFSQDVDHGLAVAARIRTGTVEINGNSAGFRAPMGGFKSSGIGREAPKASRRTSSPSPTGSPPTTPSSSALLAADDGHHKAQYVTRDAGSARRGGPGRSAGERCCG